jgi:hypothetical protein
MIWFLSLAASAGGQARVSTLTSSLKRVHDTFYLLFKSIHFVPVEFRWYPILWYSQIRYHPVQYVLVVLELLELLGGHRLHIEYEPVYVMGHISVII